MARIGSAVVLAYDNFLLILPDISAAVHNHTADGAGQNPDPDPPSTNNAPIIKTLPDYDNYFVLYRQPSAETPASLVVTLYNNNICAILYAPEIYYNWASWLHISNLRNK